MTETLKLPVLPLADSVVLPGMVVPVRLDEPEIQAAVDAAQTASTAQGPRRPPPRRQVRRRGHVAVLEQVGRLPSGEQAAVVRGEGRAQIGSGVTGPGAALWVEATPVAGRARHRPDDRAGQGVQGAGRRHPAAAGRLAGHRLGAADHRPRPARRHRRLGLLPRPGAQGAAARRDRRGHAAGAADRVDAGARRRAGGLREDRQRRPRGHGEDPARVPAAPAAGRDPQGAGRGRARRAPTTTAPASRTPTCPSTCARPRSPRSASWSGRRTRARSRAGSGPGWTRSSTCRGTPAPTTPTTWSPPGRSWTPTTPASTTSRSG